MIDLSYIIQDMKTNKDKQILRPHIRRNRFNGESARLSAEEAKKHDEIFYHEALATLEDKQLRTGGSKHWQEMRKRLHWFMKHKAKAYMVLLD